MMKEKGEELITTHPPKRLKYLISITIIMGTVMFVGAAIENFLQNDYYLGYMFLGGAIIALILGSVLYLIYAKRGEPYIVYDNCIHFPPMYTPSKKDEYVYLSDIVKIERGKYDVKNYYIYTEYGKRYKILGWHAKEILDHIGSNLGNK